MTNAHIWEIGKPGKIQSTALGSQQAMNHTAAMLREMRTDEAFSGYYTSCTTLAEQLGLAPPIRRFVRPARKIDEGTPPVQLDIESEFRRKYFEVLDAAATTIEERSHHPSLAIYVAMEHLLISAANGNDFNHQQFAEVCDFSVDDLYRSGPR